MELSNLDSEDIPREQLEPQDLIGKQVKSADFVKVPWQPDNRVAKHILIEFTDGTILSLLGYSLPNYWAGVADEPVIQWVASKLIAPKIISKKPESKKQPRDKDITTIVVVTIIMILFVVMMIRSTYQ